MAFIPIICVTVRSLPLKSLHRRRLPCPYLPQVQSLCQISTSEKKGDTVDMTTQPIQEPRAIVTSPEGRKERLGVVPKSKNWVSYGFMINNEKEDRLAMHITSFLTITVVLVFGSFMIAYYPDYRLFDWAQREAYVDILRRESAGLPHVDLNLIPLNKIDVPSDEELGDYEIVI